MSFALASTAADTVPGSAAADLLYVASGASLTVSNTNGIDLEQSGNFDIAGTATINSGIEGESALKKTGNGTLTLSGANSYTNGTTVQVGTLEATRTVALSRYNTSGQVSVSSGATLAVAVGGSGQWTAGDIDTLRSNATFSSGSALGIDTSGAGASGFTYGSNITGSLGLTKLGAGTLTLSGASTYTGDTTVAAGTLAIGTGGSITGGNISVGAGATLAISGTGSASANTSDTLHVSGTLASPASVTLADTGTLSTGFAVIGYTGPGTFTQSGGTFTTNGNGLNVAYNASSNGSSYHLSGTGSLSTTSAYVGVFGVGAFTQSGGTFTTNGNTLYLGYSNGSGGTYTLSGGTLSVGGVTGGSGLSNFHFDGGTLRAGTDSTSLLSGLGTADVLAGGAKIDTQTYNAALGQALGSGTAPGVSDGGLTKLGVGTLTLSAANSYTGGTTVNAGTLEATNTGALPGYSTSGKVTVNSGGTLAVAVGSSGQWTAANVASLLGAATFNGGSVLGLDTSGAGSSGFTYGSNITGSLSLTKLGAGMLTLTGANTFAGDLTVQAGTLAVVSGGVGAGGNANVDSAALVIDGTGSITATSGGTLNVSGAYANPAGVTLADTGVLSTGIANIGLSSAAYFTQSGGTFTTNGNAFNLGNVSYNLSGTGSLSTGIAIIGVHGTATFTQTGGTFTTNGNSLQIADGISGFFSSYRLSGGSLSTGAAYISQGTTFTQTGGAFTTNGNTLNFSVYGDNGYALGGGTLTVGGVAGTGDGNTFDFNGGTLQAAATNPNFFAGLTVAEVHAGGAIIDTQAFNVTIAQTLTSGTASGTPDGGLTKLGSGTLTLSGNNIYTGPTTLSAGTLQVGNGGTSGSLGTDTGAITDNGTLAYDRSDNLSVANVISGVGGLTKLGGGTLTLTGMNTFTGPLNIDAGTLAVAVSRIWVAAAR